MPVAKGEGARQQHVHSLYQTTISTQRAAAASTELGTFCDWFAQQAAGFGTARAAEVRA